MANNSIILKSVNELPKGFSIPDYQRGYRWTKQQVKDLLEDILEFMMRIEELRKAESNKKAGENRIYCIQPLVVKKNYKFPKDILARIKEEEELDKIAKFFDNAEIEWEVIDGQQRLTTIHILLSYLKSKLYGDNKDKFDNYAISYKTRIGSEEFLKNIMKKNDEDAKENIDFFHILETRKTIEDWVSSHPQVKLDDLLHTLIEQVQFIWYETEEQNPINVFTRLNVGQISLTNAELIKALMLNSSNFSSHNELHVRLQQIEIATEWDQIEYTLQNDKFWLFIQSNNYNKSTRIDFIFDLIKNFDRFNLVGEADKEIALSTLRTKSINQESKDWWTNRIGDDEHQTFRYFYEYFKQINQLKDKEKAEWLEKTWSIIKSYFQIFEEWYNDTQLYHYVGYLVDQGVSIDELIDKYSSSTNKENFISWLKKQIKNKIANCKKLTQQYYYENEEDESHPQKYLQKTEVRPLLILYNIQYIINQNIEFVNDERYKLPDFSRFPFHLFKLEANKGSRYGWEIEHIASNGGDDDDDKNILIYLESSKRSINDKQLIKDIDSFDINQGKSKFDKLRERVEKDLNEEPWSEADKNKIWNFTLLDSGTNQQYHNCVFPFKRICVISKENGKQTLMSVKNGKVYFDRTKKGIAFVPTCTKNVFTKTYSGCPKTLSSWTHEDAYNYLIDINNVLSGENVGFIEDQSEEIKALYNQKREGETNNE